MRNPLIQSSQDPATCRPGRRGVWSRLLVGAWAGWLTLGSVLAAGDPGLTTNLLESAASLPPPPLPDVGVSVVRIVGALALVLALFFGGLWLSRHWPRLTSRGPRNPDLRVLEMRALGARQTLWVVAYRRQRLLVASSPGGVTLLTSLPEADADEPTGPAAAPDFAAAFQYLLGRRS